MEKIHATTVICVNRNNSVCMISDGQVSLGSAIVKSSAKKVRSLSDGKVLVGFAGSVSDALTLLDRFEAKLKDFKNVKRACYELMQEWRTDKFIRHFEASLIIADSKDIFVLSGDGNILEPEDGIASVGSGSLFALSAAKALLRNTKFNAKQIAVSSMEIAAETCIYTNSNFTIIEIPNESEGTKK